MPLAATVASSRIYEAFLGEDFHSAFAHGHSFTANPLGCAARPWPLLSSSKPRGTLARIQAIHAAHGPWLDHLARLPGVTRPRRLGSIAAVNIGGPDGGQSDYHAAVGRADQGRLPVARPLGAAPWATWSTSCRPACITPQELARAHEGLAAILADLARP